MVKEQVLKKAPGFLACLVIGLIAQGIAKFVPSVGAALFAIGIGMVCGNTFLNKPGMDAGTKFSERSLLEYLSLIHISCLAMMSRSRSTSLSDLLVCSAAYGFPFFGSSASSPSSRYRFTQADTRLCPTPYFLSISVIEICSSKCRRMTVSYTHLDVYKRQPQDRRAAPPESCGTVSAAQKQNDPPEKTPLHL